MKERPILFSGDMVRALIAGTKTQTRRVVKKQPQSHLGNIRPHPSDGFLIEHWPKCERQMQNFGRCENITCPYGVPGDRLWVKEKHSYNSIHKRSCPKGENWGYDVAVEWGDGTEREVHADVKPTITRQRGEIGWRPSIHMHRWASRLTLEVTGVRVERLLDISDRDCIAEGIHPIGPEHHPAIPRREYQELWEKINGAGSWGLDPWVWVIEFRKL